MHTPLLDYVRLDRSKLTDSFPDRATIGQILARVRPFIGRALSDLDPEVNESRGSTGSTHPPARRVDFTSSELMLTDEFLALEIDVSEDLRLCLSRLRNTPRTSSATEKEITKLVIAPLMEFFIGLITDGLDDGLGGRRWSVIEHLERSNGGDLDVVLKREDVRAPREDDFCGHQMVIEMKPCGTYADGVLRRFGENERATEPSQILGQLTSQAILQSNLTPEKPCVWLGLSQPPAYLYPCFYSKATHSIAVGSNLVKGFVEGDWHECIQNEKNWVRYIEACWAMVFSALVDLDEKVSEKWLARAPEQVALAEAFRMRANDALRSNTGVFSSLIRIWATSPSLAQVLSAAAMVVIRPLKLFPTLTLPGAGTLDLDWSFMIRLPFGVTLSYSENEFMSRTALVIIYAQPRVVIKLYYDKQCYNREFACYRRLWRLQGRGIPILHAKGIRREDGLPFLITSHEGTNLNDFSHNDRAALQPVIDSIHNSGLHHHDLHCRNVVRDKTGKLSVIDFGFGGECSEELCTDEWKEEYQD
ncbi:hypothetical protein DFP72DRAFT_1176401 [Ephemerocybe angulata]|uniref:Protein kinase domain-containing protein n=1 Tax=Ephemerocybe angulata TaxID=980116 RepID=A0A8H6HE19_9AGAR|nr:hypothetical protein DFP72DRAFT_1176401 [Tulosesus angulatus]